MRQPVIWLVTFLLFSCRPLVTTFSDYESAVYYSASNHEIADYHDTLKVMTWNIRFGAARIPWFEDSCGDRVLMTEEETVSHLEAISDFLDTMVYKPDIILLQEVDVSSKRSAYLDQIQWLLDHTHFNYGVFASMWEADMIPSGGLGKVNVGNAILSRWEISDALRIQLPLRTDQDALTQFFYLRRNILKAKIKLSADTWIYAVNTHATAFAQDDTKQKHIDKYREILDDINSSGMVFVTGGDLNSIPPAADSTDFCLEDRCSDENFHTDKDGEPHREGSYFNNFSAEPDLLQPFYTDYKPAINFDENNPIHFTHSPWNTNRTDQNYWDRKLDYLFTNLEAGFLNGFTNQDAHQLSDHAPVSAIFIMPSE